MWKKNCEKPFSLSDNSISIGSVNLSLLRIEYLSLAVNVSIIFLRGTLSNSIAFSVINKYSKGAVVAISTLFELVYDVACRRLL